MPKLQKPSPQDDSFERRFLEAVNEAVHVLWRSGSQRHERLTIMHSELDEVGQEVDERWRQGREEISHELFADCGPVALAERSGAVGREVQGICAAPRLLPRSEYYLLAKEWFAQRIISYRARHFVVRSSPRKSGWRSTNIHDDPPRAHVGHWRWRRVLRPHAGLRNHLPWSARERTCLRGKEQTWRVVARVADLRGLTEGELGESILAAVRRAGDELGPSASAPTSVLALDNRP